MLLAENKKSKHNLKELMDSKDAEIGSLTTQLDKYQKLNSELEATNKKIKEEISKLEDALSKKALELKSQTSMVATTKSKGFFDGLS